MVIFFFDPFIKVLSHISLWIIQQRAEFIKKVLKQGHTFMSIFKSIFWLCELFLFFRKYKKKTLADYQSRFLTI